MKDPPPPPVVTVFKIDDIPVTEVAVTPTGEATDKWTEIDAVELARKAEAEKEARRRRPPRQRHRSKH
jgi:hypothetical protein